MPIQTVQMFARPITRDDDLRLIRVIHLGNLYYRRLAEIENDLRQKIRALGQEYESIRETLQQLQELSPEDRRGQVGDQLRTQLKAAAKRRSADPEYRARAESLNKEMFDQKRRARSQSGLAPGAWGTYQRIEQHHEFACGMTHWSDDVNPHRPVGVGQVAVHVQGRTVTHDDLLDHNWNYCQIDPDLYALGRSHEGYAQRSTGPGDWGPSRSMNRPETKPAERLREIRIRCDSHGRTPIWARLHLYDAGKIPPGKISWIWAQRARIGQRFRWKITIVVETPSPIHAPMPTADLVGVDLRCGRRVDGGRLVAHAAGSDGEQYSLILQDVQKTTRGNRTRSTGCVDSGKVADLRSIRDKCLNETIDKIRAFTAELPEGHPIREEARHAHAWRRWGRVAAFTRRLSLAAQVPLADPPPPALTALPVPFPREWDPTPPAPSPGPESEGQILPQDKIDAGQALVIDLQATLKQNRHLEQWQTFQSQKLSRRAHKQIQQWCAMLAGKYGTIAFENLSIKDLKEESTPLGHVVARGIQAMSPGHVRRAAEQCANKRGRGFFKVDYRNTTRTCASCGHLRNTDLALDLVACERCGAVSPPWVTAAANILRRASDELRAQHAAMLADESPTTSPRRVLNRRNRKRKEPEIARE